MKRCYGVLANVAPLFWFCKNIKLRWHASTHADLLDARKFVVNKHATQLYYFTIAMHRNHANRIWAIERSQVERSHVAEVQYEKDKKDQLKISTRPF